MIARAAASYRREEPGRHAGIIRYKRIRNLRHSVEILEIILEINPPRLI